MVAILEALTDDARVQTPKGPLGTVLKGIHKAIGLRRAIRGPKRPSWSHEFETFATFLHHYARRSVYLPLRMQRNMPGLILDGELTRRVSFEDVDAGGVPSEWFRHDEAEPGRVLLYLHGGGYSICSIDSHRELMCRLAIAGKTAVLGIEYRLAPEHPFPAQLEDSTSAYRWLLDQGIEPKRIIIAGDSAGGGLTMSTLLQLRDDGDPLPAAGVLLSPWVDLEASSGSYIANEPYDYLSRRAIRRYAKRFVGTADLRNPLAAPIHADLSGLPPLLIHAGGAEALLNDSLQLARKARDAGVEVQLDVWPDMTHVWQLFASFVPEGVEAIDQIGRFVDARALPDLAALSNVALLKDG